MKEYTPLSDRDLIGAQMGYAVNMLLPPIPLLKAVDKKIMRLLPVPIASAITVERFQKGWLPDGQDPTVFYTSLINGLGKKYLQQYGYNIGADTLLMPGFGTDIRVHAPTYIEEIGEHSISWDMRVKWARHTLDVSRIIDMQRSRVMEAEEIEQINEQMRDSVKILKPVILKHGLPIPQIPTV